MSSPTYDYVIVGAGSAGCARGGTAGHQREDPRPARLSRAATGGARLGLPLGARVRVLRSPDSAAAGQGAGRILLDQRDDLRSRQRARLRRMGRHGLVVGGPAAVFPEGRGQRARSLAVARRRRSTVGERAAIGEPGLARVRGRRGAGWARAQRGLQRRRAGRCGHLPADPARGDARERGGRVSASGHDTLEPDRDGGHAGAARAVRARARGRRPGEPARTGARPAGRA